MSRCFPYPPPGYERKSVALDEALINSIKLQKEKEKAKKEKRKEKKREKKEKEKARDNGGTEDKKHKHEKKHRSERGKVEHSVGDKRKRTEEEAEQLEKSGLTEEQGQPISSQNLYDSTDSTQNSHKRKKYEPPADGSNHNHGSIFRIRLKPKDQAVLLSRELQVPNSGRDDHTLQAKYEIPQILGEEKPFSTSGRQQQASTSGRTTFAKQDSLKQKDQDVLSNNEIGGKEKIPSINNTARKESLEQKDQDILNKTNIARKESLKQKDPKISSYTNTARKESLKQKDQDTLNNSNIARKESLKQKDQEILCNTNVARKEDLKQKGQDTLISTNVAGKGSWKQKGQEILNNTNIATKEILKQKDQDVLSNKNLSPTAFSSGPSLHVKHEISPKISEVQNCPTSRITTVVQERFGNDSRPSEEHPCSTSGRTSIEAFDGAERSRKSSRKPKKIESLYRELIENWVPPGVENEGADFDDQDWLFERRPKSEPEPKRSKPGNDVMCEGSSSMWPRACYLPEADVYALPYTVPF